MAMGVTRFVLLLIGWVLILAIVRAVVVREARTGRIGWTSAGVAIGVVWAALPFAFELLQPPPPNLSVAALAGAILFVVTALTTIWLGRKLSRHPPSGQS